MKEQTDVCHLAIFPKKNNHYHLFICLHVLITDLKTDRVFAIFKESSPMNFSELGVCKQKRTTVVTPKVTFSDCDCPSSSSIFISDDHKSDINNHKSSLVVKCFDPKKHYLHEAQDCFLYNSHLNEELQTIQRHIDQNVAECRRHEGQLSRDTSYIRNTDLCSITNKPSKGVLLGVDKEVFENSLIPQVIIAPGGKLDTCKYRYVCFHYVLDVSFLKMTSSI